MNVFINQFFGIGDIIFCMTIARRFIAQGYNVTWGTLPHFLDGLRRAYPDITWVDYRKFKIDYDKKGEHDAIVRDEPYRVVPLRWNVEILGVPYSQCMASKYDLFGWHYKDWKEQAHFERGEKENELAELLGIDFNKPYTLTNRFFGSNSQFCVQVESRGIEMQSIEGYSLFDWAKIIENAECIHTANTSILYLLELLDLKAKEVHLYCRKPQEKDFRNTE